MTAKPIPVTRKRIVALALIALTTLGLAYLHFAGGSTSVSVPVGRARGSADPEALHLRKRAGGLRHARRSREPARPAFAPDRTADHAHPRTHAEPRRADLPAPGRSRPDEHGLPRGEALHRPPRLRARRLPRRRRLLTPRLPRGSRVDRAFARPAQQGVVRSQTPPPTVPAPSGSKTKASISPGYSLAERVDDLELARHRLGYGPIDLISESAGTRTAMIYAWRYPQSIHRSVMVAANPPGNYLWNAKTTDEQIHRYAGRRALRPRTAAAGRPTSPRRSTPPTRRSRAASCSCRSRRATSASPASSAS